MSECTLAILRRETAGLAEQLSLLKSTPCRLSADEVLVRLVLVGQRLSDLKKAVAREMFSLWGLSSLQDEEAGDVMSTIETIIERIGLELGSCAACPGSKTMR